MIDVLNAQTLEELGTLHPNWFELLSTKAVENEAQNVPIPEPQSPRTSHRVVESCFKTPTEKQMVSTPKTLSSRRLEPYGKQEAKTHQGAESSPCLFGIKHGQSVDTPSQAGVSVHLEESFLDAANISAETVQRISESLGARIHPDMSWTSSLNTPPPMSPTVILSKKEDASHSVSVSEEPRVVFVRKLFPSISEASVNPNPSLGNRNNVCSQQPGIADDPSASVEKTECPLGNGVWKQKLPDAIKDGEVRSTVTSVLQGAEDVLSFLFDNSGTLLRKVKAPERVRRKQSKPGNEAVPISSVGPSGLSVTSLADVQPDRNAESPKENTDDDQTPWTPMAFPETATVLLDGICNLPSLPLCHVSASANGFRENVSERSTRDVEEVPSQCSPVDWSETGMKPYQGMAHSPSSVSINPMTKNVVRSPVGEPLINDHAPVLSKGDQQSLQYLREEEHKEVPVSLLNTRGMKGTTTQCTLGWTPKDNSSRKFVYSLPKPLVSGTTHQSSVVCNSEQDPLNPLLREERETCKDGSKTVSDFKDLYDWKEQTSVKQDTNNGIDIHADDHKGISEKTEPHDIASDMEWTTWGTEHLAMTNHNTSSHACIPGFPYEIHSFSEEQLLCGFTTKDKNVISSPSEVKDFVGESEGSTTAKRTQVQSTIKDSAIGDSCKATHTDDNFAEKTRNPIAAGKAGDSGLPSDLFFTGFRTGANSVIKVSPTRLERAKLLLEEGEDAIFPASNNEPFSDKTEKAKITALSVCSSTQSVLGGSSLTASQRADVFELCSLLEEANSQFEFTQFRQPNVMCCMLEDSRQNLSQKEDSHLLAGIDFSESVSTHEEQQIGQQQLEPEQVVECQYTSLGLPLKADQTLLESGDLLNFVGFSFAGGKKVTVSNESLKKALSVFDGCDFEDDPKHSAGMYMSTSCNSQMKDFCENIGRPNCLKHFDGFKTAKGKALTISENALNKVSAVFADVEDPEFDKWAGCNFNHRERKVPDHHAKSVPRFSFNGKKVSAQPSLQDYEDKGKYEIKHAKSDVNGTRCETVKHCVYTTIGSVLDSPQNAVCTFTTARGKGIQVSEKALKDSKAIFSDIECVSGLNINEEKQDDISKNSTGTKNDINLSTATEKRVTLSNKALLKAKPLLHVGDTTQNLDHVTCYEKTESLNDLGPNICGFSTASGKGLSVSEKSLQQAEALFRDCDDANCDNVGRSVNSDQVCKDSRFNFMFARDKGASAPEKAVATKDLHDVSNHQIHYQTASSNKGMGTAGSAFHRSVRGSHCGFSTAQGKKVPVSKAALLKAKAIFKGCDEDCPEEPLNSLAVNLEESSVQDFFTDTSCGFSTANGKGVSISLKALKDAKANLSDVAEVRSFIEDGTTQEDGACGVEDKLELNTVYGSKGHVSNNALQNSVSVLAQHDNHDRSETQRSVGKKYLNGHELVRGGCSFSTASGKGVTISKQALQQAKALLEDCNVANSIGVSSTISSGKISMEDNCRFSIADDDNVLGKSVDLKARHGDCNGKGSYETGASAFLRRKEVRGFHTAQGRSVSVSKVALLKTKAIFKGSDEDHSEEFLKPFAVEPGEGSVQDFSPNISCGFSRANRRNVSVKSPPDTKAMCSDVEEAKSLEESSKTRDVDNTFGFSTAYSRNMHVMDNALLKDVAFLDSHDSPLKNESYFGKNKYLMHQHSGQDHCGFSTASGKGVSISELALSKAKALFDNCVGNISCTKSGKTHTTPEKVCSVDNLEAQPFGFSTASGKCMAISSKGLEKAKDMFKECLEDLEDTVVSKGNANMKSVQNGRSVENIGLTGPLKAVLDKSDPREANGVKTEKTCNLRYSNIDQAETQKREEQTTESMGNAISLKLVQGKEDGTSCAPGGLLSLRLRSLGLTGCTVTQQKFVEEEAEACAKALLEDEDLARDFQEEDFTSCCPDPQNSEQNCVRTRKRMRAQDLVLKADQPPIKRRLLSEFDRTLDEQKCSMLTPLKTSPSSTLKDRRKFRYHTTIQPNITQPFGYKSQILKKSDAPCAVSISSKVNGFLPPFHNHPTPERKAELKASGKTPHVFVPPFKNSTPKINSEATKAKTENKHSCSISAEAGKFNPPYKNKTNCVHGSSLVHCGDGGTAGEKKELFQEVPVSSPYMSDGKDALGSDKILEGLLVARSLQEMRIRKKKQQTIRPQPGSLFLAKTSGRSRMSLWNAVGGSCPRCHTPDELYKHGVDRKASQISSHNAESFRFLWRDFYSMEALVDESGVQLADGGWLIPDNKGTVGKEEFYRALCDTPGVDPKLISDHWVYNHYRWVVWKQASMERSFPQLLGSQCLTPEQVLLQLKHRYDVEVDGSRRSALKKIMERDDTSVKTLVLCVCGIVSTTSPEDAAQPSKVTPGGETKADTAIWVTDGWYAIKAHLDAPLANMVQRGRLPIGGKIITHGAELVGSQEACAPLEAPSSLMLKISANSTRLARWHTRLGFYRDPRPFRVPLSSLYTNGGLVGCTEIIVLRSYPTQWMEKRAHGGPVFRNDRTEEREARQHADRRQKAMELLFANVQAQFEKDVEATRKARSRRRLSRQELDALQDGEELHEAVDNDPSCLDAGLLSEQQLATLSRYRRSLQQERQARLQERFQQALQEDKASCGDREVTPVWRLSVTDLWDQTNVYALNIWRPSADLCTLLKEGWGYRVHQLSASEGRRRVGMAALQLTATKRTRFQQLQTTPEQLSSLYKPRVCTSFRTLLQPDFSSLCGEVDVVGFIISVSDSPGNCVLHLADEWQHCVAVRTSGSLSQLALEDVVKPRILLALSNLHPGTHTTSQVPTLYAGELTVFSTKPRETHLQEACTHLKATAQTQGWEEYFRATEAKLLSLMGTHSIAKTPTWSVMQQARSLESGSTPQRGKLTEDNDPRSVKRKRSLDYLSRIPSPPPLPPLGISTSPCVSRTFQPPRPSHALLTTHTAGGDWVIDEELAMIDTQTLLASSESPR